MRIFIFVYFLLLLKFAGIEAEKTVTGTVLVDKVPKLVVHSSK